MVPIFWHLGFSSVCCCATTHTMSSNVTEMKPCENKPNHESILSQRKRIVKLLTIVVKLLFFSLSLFSRIHKTKMAFIGIGIQGDEEEKESKFQHVPCSCISIPVDFPASFLFASRSDLITKIIINLMLYFSPFFLCVCAIVSLVACTPLSTIP